MRFLILLWAAYGVCLAQSPQTTRALVDGDGRGVAGYLHRPNKSSNVRVVLEPTIKTERNEHVYWSHDGVGWEVQVHPDIGLKNATELIPLSIHEYRLKAKADKLWPTYELMSPTTVYRRDDESKAWKIVASSGRRFVWSEGFTLQDGDVIALREVDGY